MSRRSILVQRIVLSSIASVAVALATSSWQKDDPAQWTSEDVYQILNNSPWSKSVRVTVARGSGYGDDTSRSGRGGGTWGEGMPGGGMGRSGGGWGGGGMGRGRGGGYPSAEQAPAVTVQWASALPVRLAEAKSSGGPTDPSAMKPLEEYIVAVIGLPKSGFGPRGSTSSSGDDSDDAAFADHLKVITVLSIAQQRLNPTKVELNQGRDGRTVFHFDKSEPVTAHDKDVEFRITSDHMELKQKFALKNMEYQGKLEL